MEKNGKLVTNRPKVEELKLFDRIGSMKPMSVADRMQKTRFGNIGGNITGFKRRQEEVPVANRGSEDTSVV